MATQMRLLPVRVTPALRRLIDQVGAVNPASRALLLLGAASAGLDLSGLEREIAGLLAAPLDAAVQASLRQLFTHLTTTPPRDCPAPPVMGEQAGVREAAAPSEEPADPFASIGIEV